MDLKKLLFSFDGRIRRSHYWIGNLICFIIMCAGVAVDMFTSGEVGVGYALGAVLAIVPAIALGIKRCHDRNRSGWFFLVSLVPIVSLWYLVEIGFLRGTVGPNRFGPDPKEEGELVAVS